MVRGGRAEAPAPRSDVSSRLNQKTANFKAAIPRRTMQWSKLAEEKQKNQFAQTEFPKVSLHQNNNTNKGRQLHVVLCVHISIALQQKTANFKVAIHSRPMQWGGLTEGKQKNELAS
jgi:hypothetical protein